MAVMNPMVQNFKKNKSPSKRNQDGEKDPKLRISS